MKIQNFMFVNYIIVSVVFVGIFGQVIVFPNQVDNLLETLRIPVSTRNALSSITASECNLPTNQLGDCVSYNQCDELKQRVARTGLTRATVRALRSRLCAVNNGIFRLCCKKQAIPLSVTIKPPTTNNNNNANIIPTNDQCGFATGTRIIRGEDTQVGDNPWLVGLGSVSGGKFQIQCGGSLITRRHVLSASHCFVRQRGVPPITHVRLGEHSLTQETEPVAPLTIQISRTVNPGYDTNSHVNDLELIQMEQDVEFSNYVRPLCLPFEFRDTDFTGQTMVIVGWGDTTFQSRTGNDIPLKALVPVITRQQCNEAYNRQAEIQIGPNRICASSQTFDACQGDSGGPMIYEASRSVLMGVVSFGIDCATGTFPGVYTHVPAYLDWILNNL